jgi:hypothetical protein
MTEGRVNNGWAFVLAAFPFWGTLLVLAVIETSGRFTFMFGEHSEYLKLLQDETNVIRLWIYWMAGSFFLSILDMIKLQNKGIALRGWECALNLLLPPAYFFMRNWTIVASTGKEQPAHGWLHTTWIAAVGFNVIFFGLVSADRLYKIAKDCALLVAWVLIVAVLWSIGERLYASLRKQP